MEHKKIGVIRSVDQSISRSVDGSLMSHCGTVVARSWNTNTSKIGAITYFHKCWVSEEPHTVEQFTPHWRNIIPVKIKMQNCWTAHSAAHSAIIVQTRINVSSFIRLKPLGQPIVLRKRKRVQLSRVPHISERGEHSRTDLPLSYIFRHHVLFYFTYFTIDESSWANLFPEESV